VRRSHLIVVTTTAALVGSLAAHAAGLFSAAPHVERAGEKSASVAGAVPTLIARAVPTLIAVAAVATLAALVSVRRRGPAIAVGALAAPAAFGLQEVVERLLHSEAIPFNATHEIAPGMGLVLQLPLAFAVVVLIRALSRSAARGLIGAGRPTDLSLPRLTYRAILVPAELGRDRDARPARHRPRAPPPSS